MSSPKTILSFLLFGSAFLRLRNTSSFTRALEEDWINEWPNRGKHRGYTGPALITRVVNRMLAKNGCSLHGVKLLDKNSVFGIKFGDENIPDAAAFHSSLNYWMVDGENPGPKRDLELQRACPNVRARMASGQKWDGSAAELIGP
jgi:hypothetical protein